MVVPKEFLLIATGKAVLHTVLVTQNSPPTSYQEKYMRDSCFISIVVSYVLLFRSAIMTEHAAFAGCHPAMVNYSPSSYTFNSQLSGRREPVVSFHWYLPQKPAW